MLIVRCSVSGAYIRLREGSRSLAERRRCTKAELMAGGRFCNLPGPEVDVRFILRNILREINLPMVTTFQKNALFTGLLALMSLVFATANGQTEEWLIKGRDRYGIALKTGKPDDFRSALEAYELALLKDPENVEAFYLKGMCHYALQEYAAAGKALEQVLEINPEPAAEVYFYVAESNFFQARYAEAVPAYEAFLDVPRAGIQLRGTARTRLRKAEWAAQHLADSIEFRPRNLGPNINGPGEDYNAFLTADDSLLLFNSHRAGNIGGHKPRVFHEYGSDFYMGVRTGPAADAWQEAVHLGKPLNSLTHEKEFWWSGDGQRLLFGRHPLYVIMGEKDCDIYESQFDGARGWAEPRKIGGGADSPQCDSWPSLSADGRSLYFVSNRPGGQGGYDIWLTQWDGRQWGEATNLGPTINTPGDEFDVFIHPDDQTLYFTSNYHPGFGGYDIFRARRRPGGSWQRPENLGYPLNTPFDEFDFFVNASGTTGYINSNRRGGEGQQDLYAFALDERIRPLPIRIVKGKVVDLQNGAPLPARVAITDLATGDTLQSVTTRPSSGEFLLTLPPGGELGYALRVEGGDGYLFYSLHFDQDTLSNRTDLRIELPPLEPGAKIVLNNVFFDVDQAELKPASKLELKAVAEVLKQHPTMQVELAGHTDSDASEAHNRDLSQRRARAVKAFLVEQGIAAERLTAKGYGESEPLVPNTSAANKARNRRTELHILKL